MHPHLHIVYNRICNDGKLIPDRNERFRNIRFCKALSFKYGLTLGKRKKQVPDIYPSAESLLSDDGNFVAAGSCRIALADSVPGISQMKIPSERIKTNKLFVSLLLT